MKELNVLNKNWKVGDIRDLTGEQVDKLVEDDLYDSYDRTYELDGLKWKIASKIAMQDGSAIYSLEAVERT